MKNHLVLEVEFLTGISVATDPRRPREAEWPPHPDRLFQALVAAWGRFDEPREDEKSALKWLESFDGEKFSIFAPKSHARTVASVYVPPNDMRTGGKAGARIPKDLRKQTAVLPVMRTNRQERFFPAVLPAAEPPIVYYRWAVDEDDERSLTHHLPALQRLAREVTYLGHSHSLVRVAARGESGSDTKPPEATNASAEQRQTAVPSLRMPYPGRLEHLQQRYAQAMRTGQAVRPLPSLHMSPPFSRKDELGAKTIFDEAHALTFAGEGNFVPALAAFPAVARRFRKALLEHGPADESFSFLSGRDENGQPATGPRVTIVPLADVGWPHASGRLLGLGLLFPRAAGMDERSRVMEHVVAFLQANGDGVGRFKLGPRGEQWGVRWEQDPLRASLNVRRYFGPATRWNTVLPIALDRHPKGGERDGIVQVIKQSCRYVGLPDAIADGLSVEIHRFSAVARAPSCREVGRFLAPDSPYRSRRLVHAVLDFPEPVHGPLLLGAGRFQGLGLCLPVKGKGGGTS